MKRRLLALSALLLAGGCGSGASSPPAASQAYLVIPARDDARGWAVVDHFAQELPEDDRRRIGVPTVASEASSTMIVPVTGDCALNRRLTERVDAIARAQGISGTRCSATFPG